MKSTALTRTAIAATMTLAVAGALFAAKPANAQTWISISAQPAVVAPGFIPNGNAYGYWHHRGDHRGPDIVDVTPDSGQAISDRGLTHISARYYDNRTGVSAVSLRVDGRDVTHRARVDADQIRYRENLAPGRHYAELLVRDNAGNTSRRTWTFDVVNSGYGFGGWTPGGYSRW